MIGMDVLVEKPVFFQRGLVQCSYLGIVQLGKWERQDEISNALARSV